MLQDVCSHVETQPGCGEYIEETAGTTTSASDLERAATRRARTGQEIAVSETTATANSSSRSFAR